MSSTLQSDAAMLTRTFADLSCPDTWVGVMLMFAEKILAVLRISKTGFCGCCSGKLSAGQIFKSGCTAEVPMMPTPLAAPCCLSTNNQHA
jgi:hypothetical protein